VPPRFMMCRCEPLRSSGYGHMADGIRPEQAVHRTACSTVVMVHPVAGLTGEDHRLYPDLAYTRDGPGVYPGGSPGGGARSDVSVTCGPRPTARLKRAGVLHRARLRRRARQAGLERCRENPAGHPVGAENLCH
jgi:hypothetical protein